MASPFASTNRLARYARQFSLVEHFTNGYRNREDITTLPPGVLVEGSQNVLTNTYQRVGIRKGYTLDGAANTDLAPIGGQNGAMGVFDWRTSGGEERNMRAGFLTSAGNDGKLQFRYEYVDGSIEWVDLLTGLSSIDFNFITFWDSDTLELQLLMVNGESNIRSWGGQIAIVSSATNTAGIIGEVEQPGDLSQILVSGGYGYTVNDTVTVSGGGGNATLNVDTIAAGAISAAVVNANGSGYVVGNQFTINGGTGGQFHAIGQVATVDGGGGVLTFTILGNGTGYSSTSNVATTNLSGSGTGFTVDTTVSGGAISAWSFTSDAHHGTGYSNNTTYTLTGGTGSGAHIRTDLIVSGTIVKTGTESWAASGFVFADGPEMVLINGTTYTYDGLDFIGDTTTLYGVSPDPSAIPADSPVIQAVKTWANAGGSTGLPIAFKNDLIGTIDGRVFIASKTSALIYISAYASFVTWANNLTVILSSCITAIVPQEDALYVSAGHDEWYKIATQLSADLSGAVFVINRLNTAVQQSAQSQAATNKIANSIIFLSFEPVIETFGPVADIFLGPQMADYSYSIVNLMNSLDLTNVSLMYYRKFVYVAVPREGLVLIYNMTNPKNPYWEAPQVMPISRFSVINGDLYGHSSQVSETYKLFDGTNDNGFPILARATFSFNNYGNRATSKGYNEFYVEGYISENTTLTLGIQYDIDGCATTTSYDINGDDSQIVCLASDSASLGKVPLGTNPLGGQLAVPNAKPKFRVVKTFPTNYFYEDQISFTSEDIDEQWEILAFGPQLLPGGNLNNSIQE